MEIHNELIGRKLLFVEFGAKINIYNEVVTEIGVTREKGKLKCNRCGNEIQHLFGVHMCYKCGKECIYCRKCITMGKVTMCTNLYSIPSLHTHFKFPTGKLLDLEFTLTENQKEASNKICKAVETQSTLLIWAVCGAGKTEMLFQGIEKALILRKRVCVAAPRTDVILELAPRLQKAFPTTEIGVFYGDSPMKNSLAPLILSTTHQLLRFKQTFDLMILDEMDAFPYSIDASLKYAVKEATTPIHTMVYLSATPSKYILRKLTQNQIIFVPARHHGNPLPVPKLKWVGNWKRKLPEIIKQTLVQKINQGRMVFLFVPSVNVGVGVEEELGSFAQFVHANDPDRIHKVQQFRDGEVSCLITTTILERGVTVPFADVIVLGAEEVIFTESALVQISGRAGRVKEDVNGEVIFFHEGITRDMRNAVQHIRKMNARAVKR